VTKLPGAPGKLPGEFELIARLSAGIRVSRRTILGAGDDCAIVSRPRGQTLFTIDSLVENVHFDLRWGTAQALGARALAVNLSDIAAMGGRPTACVVNLAVREGISARTLERIYAGLRNAAREAATDIVGARAVDHHRDARRGWARCDASRYGASRRRDLRDRHAR